jgi:hypothetical protein
MRSAARGYIRPYKDDPSVRIPIRWYVVPETNPYLSIPTCFFWDQWPKEEPTAYPAIEDAYTWNNGKPPSNPPVPSFYCGSKDQWENGCLTTDRLQPGGCLGSSGSGSGSGGVCCIPAIVCVRISNTSPHCAELEGKFFTIQYDSAAGFSYGGTSVSGNVSYPCIGLSVACFPDTGYWLSLFSIPPFCEDANGTQHTTCPIPSFPWPICMQILPLHQIPAAYWAKCNPFSMTVPWTAPFSSCGGTPTNLTLTFSPGACSGSGSGSGGGGPVITACCPNGLPLALHATFHNVSNCACCQGASVPITWNVPAYPAQYSGVGLFCGSVSGVRVLMSCYFNGLNWVWLLMVQDIFTGRFVESVWDPAISNCTAPNFVFHGSFGTGIDGTGVICPGGLFSVQVGL